MREEINLENAGKVVGGAYVTTSMTLGEIVGTDRNLAGILASVGIPVVGNKTMMGESLYEAAQARGINPDALENRINDYLASK